MIAAALLAAQLLLGAARADTTSRLPAIVTQPTIDTSAVVNFRALVRPETVYVGQQATYELGVFVDQRVHDRLRRMEALAPDLRSVMAYEPPGPTLDYPERSAGSHRYDVHLYQRAIFPLTTGHIPIPPAHLVYALPLTYSFFSREQNFELRSDSLDLVALPTPAAGRPPDYRGAVGSFRADVRLDTTGAGGAGGPVRVGDALRLAVRVAGSGDIQLLPRPSLAIPWATAVATRERVRLSPDSVHIGGTKEFDWLLTPLRAGRQRLPPVRYPYWDPVARRYRVATTRAQTLDVAPGSLAPMDTSPVAARPAWTVRTTYGGPLAPPPYDHGSFWALLLAAPLPALAVATARRQRRPRRPRPARDLLHAAARTGAPAVSPALVRRVFLRAVADRIGIPAVALAEPAALEHAARRAGTTAATAGAAAALLRELDRLAFGATGESPESGLARRAAVIERAIDHESRRRRAPRPTAALGIAVLATAVALHGAAPDRDAARFAAGVRAYHAHRFAAAAGDFGRITERQPRAADAWANFGTASFAMADTARAIVGWERALRLEPAAADMRARLESVVPAGAEALATVPSIPPRPLVEAAALLWLAGWLAIAWRMRRSATGHRGTRGAVAAIMTAVLLGIAALTVVQRDDPHGLAVVARTTALRALPTLGSEWHQMLGTGTLTRMVTRAGPWMRVTTGTHEGWVEAARLRPLVRE